MTTHTQPKKSREPFFWALFSAGGMITAIVTPVLIIIVGFLVPAHHVGFHRLDQIFRNPVSRLIVFALASLTFVHAAHRLRHSLLEMGLKPWAQPIAALCYGAALAGAVWAGVVAFT
jgi:fumarate reductase subunit D